MKISVFAWITGIVTLLGCTVFPVFASNTSNVALKGNLIVNPPCELTSVDGSDTINVDFGDLVIRKMGVSLSDRTYAQPLPYQLVCDAPGDTGIRIYLKGDSAGFNRSLLATKNENVGILFLNGTGRFTPNGSWAGMTVGNQTVMQVVPIRNNAEGVTVEAGSFSAVATLTAAYP
nr:fimbrial protein [uncultured Moellerella sp.]